MVKISYAIMTQTGTGVVRILIVEDNRGDVLLVREALKESSLKFELTHIADGEQAFDYLQRCGVHRDADRPNLVLLDLNLPKRDGWEVLDEIRTMPDLRATPVVILSSSGNPEDRERAARTRSSGLPEELRMTTGVARRSGMVRI